MKILVLAAALLVTSPPCRAFPFPRPVIKSVWSLEAAAPWDSAPEVEAAGLSFKAVNDSETLRVLISAIGRDGRNLLSGTFHQDLTIWFLKPDGKSRAWGLRMPYSRLEPGADFLVRADWRPGDETRAPGVAPEWVAPPGSTVSSAALPSEVRWLAFFSQRKPALELSVPFKSLPSKFFDFMASYAPAIIEQRFHELAPPGRALPFEAERPAEDEDVVGRIGPLKLRNSNYRRRGPSRSGEITPPTFRHLRFALRLAKPSGD